MVLKCLRKSERTSVWLRISVSNENDLEMVFPFVDLSTTLWIKVSISEARNWRFTGSEYQYLE